MCTKCSDSAGPREVLIKTTAHRPCLSISMALSKRTDNTVYDVALGQLGSSCIARGSVGWDKDFGNLLGRIYSSSTSVLPVVEQFYPQVPEGCPGNVRPSVPLFLILWLEPFRTALVYATERPCCVHQKAHKGMFTSALFISNAACQLPAVGGQTAGLVPAADDSAMQMRQHCAP